MISTASMPTGKLDKWNLLEVSVGFDVTRKGERSLVINGYKFTKSRDGVSDRVFWRCSRRECKATAVTVGEKLEHVRILHDHERPPSGEFYASAASAVTVATATAGATALTGPGGQRIRRKSCNQQQQPVRDAFQQSKSESSPPRNRSTLLEQKSPPPPPDVNTGACETSVKFGNGIQPPPPTEAIVATPPGVKVSTLTEINSRGLSALADAAASQSKRDSQDSTIEPPFEAPAASPSTLPSGLPLLLLGPPDLTSTLLMGGTNALDGAPLLTTPAPYFSSSCTRRFSISEMPISARSCLSRSSLQTDQYSSFPATNFHEAATAAGVRGGMLLHWKKEKMLESKAEEEKAEQEQLLQQQQQQNFGRRRYYTASPSSVARPGTVVAAPASSSSTASLTMVLPSNGVAVAATGEKEVELPTLKRKRCASACHPPHVLSPPSASPSNNLPSVSSLDPPTTLTRSSPLDADWCVRVHNDLQTQMYTTIRQLLARVNAAEGTENVMALCSAITACLDTITASKRARFDLPPPSLPP